MPLTPTSGANVANVDLQVLPGYPVGERIFTWATGLEPPETPKLRVGTGATATVYDGSVAGQQVTFDLPDLGERVGLPVVIYDDLGTEEDPDEEPRVAGEVVRWAGGSSIPTEVLIRPTATGTSATAVPAGGPRSVVVRSVAGDPAEVDLSDVPSSVATVVIEPSTHGARVRVTGLPEPGSRGPLNVIARATGGLMPSLTIDAAGETGSGIVLAGIAGRATARLTVSATTEGDAAWRIGQITHHVVYYLAGDVDMSGGDWTSLPLAGGGTKAREEIIGTSVCVIDGDDVGIWTVTASGPCRAGEELTGGDLVTDTTGLVGVATDDNSSPPSVESVTLAGTGGGGTAADTAYAGPTWHRAPAGLLASHDWRREPEGATDLPYILDDPTPASWPAFTNGRGSAGSLGAVDVGNAEGGVDGLTAAMTVVEGAHRGPDLGATEVRRVVMYAIPDHDGDLLRSTIRLGWTDTLDENGDPIADSEHNSRATINLTLFDATGAGPVVRFTADLDEGDPVVRVKVGMDYGFAQYLSDEIGTVPMADSLRGAIVLDTDSRSWWAEVNGVQVGPTVRLEDQMDGTDAVLDSNNDPLNDLSEPPTQLDPITTFDLPSVVIASVPVNRGDQGWIGFVDWWALTDGADWDPEDPPYSPAVPADWADPPPTSVAEALDRLAAAASTP